MALDPFFDQHTAVSPYFVRSMSRVELTNLRSAKCQPPSFRTRHGRRMNMPFHNDKPRYIAKVEEAYQNVGSRLAINFPRPRQHLASDRQSLSSGFRLFRDWDVSDDYLQQQQDCVTFFFTDDM